MPSILQITPMLRTRVKMQSIKHKDPCLGGYCELSTLKNKEAQFFSKGEGKSPPMKQKDDKIAYQLSYPDSEMVKPVTIEPSYIFWIGRRWYSSP
jgi:hypothetical protein